MRKFLLFILVLFINIFIVKISIYTSSPSSRTLASISEKFSYNCREVVSFFGDKNSFNQDLYIKYKLHYESLESFDSLKNDFEDDHDYIAWLDIFLKNQNLDLSSYLIKKNKVYFKSIKKLNSKDLLSSFLSPINSRILLKSIKIKKQHRSVDHYIRQRLFSEAMAKILSLETDKAPTRWQRFFKSSFISRVGSVLNYSPILAGLPPLRLPKVDSKIKAKLLMSASHDDVQNVFKDMNRIDKVKIKSNFYYDVISNYYIYAVSGFYLYLTANELVAVEEHEEDIESINNALDDLVAQHKLLEVSCDSLTDCLEYYRDEWKDNKELLYPQYRQSCIDIYAIPRSCTE